jgi:hypothetical protein
MILVHGLSPIFPTAWPTSERSRLAGAIGDGDDGKCPTLITQAEEDGLGADAEAFFDALVCPKTLMRFTAAEGASGHCEMGNRSLLNGRVLDWLDEQFAVHR